MKHMLDRLSGKPDEGDDENAHAAAKMQVLHELRNMAMGMMGDKVKDKLPMHEVDVQAPDAAGLHKGLDLAKSIIPGSDKSSNSRLPHQGSNGSPMDAGAEDVEEQTEHGRSEPEGDEGEPDQSMLNPHRDSSTEDDGDDEDMSHEEIDQMIEDLKAAKQAKMSKEGRKY